MYFKMKICALEFADGLSRRAARGHEFLGMFDQLFDSEGFAARWGLRTAEKRHPCYNYTVRLRLAPAVASEPR